MLRRALLRCLTVTAALVAVPNVAEGAPTHRATAADAVAGSGGELPETLWQAQALAGSKQAVYPLVADQMNRLTSSLDDVRSAHTHRQL